MTRIIPESLVLSQGLQEWIGDTQLAIDARLSCETRHVDRSDKSAAIHRLYASVREMQRALSLRRPV